MPFVGRKLLNDRSLNDDESYGRSRIIISVSFAKTFGELPGSDVFKGLDPKSVFPRKIFREDEVESRFVT